LRATSARRTRAPRSPPIRVYQKSDAALDYVFTTVSVVRTLSSGKLLVLDVRGQRIGLVEPDLGGVRMIADTSGKAPTPFLGVGGFIPGRGDTTFFVDTRSLALVAIDRDGKFGRAMAIPSAASGAALSGGTRGFPGFDGAGRLVFRGQFPIPPLPSVGKDGFVEMPVADLPNPLVRLDLSSRVLDTVTSFRTATSQMAFQRDPEGRASIYSTDNPLPVADDWAVLPDGTVAVVRVMDYHVDYYDAAGRLRAGPKLPWDWQRLDDAMKVAFIDSVKTNMMKIDPSREYIVADSKERAPAAMFGLGLDGKPLSSNRGISEEAAPMMAGTAPRNAGAAASAPPRPRPVFLMSPDKLPDYAPPFAPGAVRVDGEGRLWIRTSKSFDGASLYHVVDREGRLVDRVMLPAGRVVVGFGPQGAVYLAVRSGAGTRLERITISGAVKRP
jgi:hypothetical protein